MEEVEVLAPTKVVTTVVNVNSFISTLDHLPCDIVRSLWLIQSLNFRIDGAKTRMAELLAYPRSKEVLVSLVRTKCQLQRYARELMAESRHLSDKLQWHKNFLVNDKDTMDKLVEMRAQIAENENLDFEKFKSEFFKDLEKAASFQEYFKTHFGNKQSTTRALRKSEKPKKNTTGEISAHKPKITLKLPPVRKEMAKKEEPTYCLCRGVSFGKMVACDNLECEIEWFHYKCVGLTQAPRGKWYCPNCTEERAKGTPKKKKRRKGF